MEVINKDDILLKKENYILSKKNKANAKKNKNSIPVDQSIAPKEKNKPYVVGLFCSLIGIAATLALLFYTNKKAIQLILPVFFPPLLAIYMVTVVLYACITIGLFFVIKQNVSNKIYLLYMFNAIANILLILALFLLQNIMATIILSIVIFYLAFTLFNELKKVNKIALYTFLPYCVWSIFVMFTNYLVLMMN